MRKILLLMSCLTCGISLNAQLVNGDFESAASPLLPGIATDCPGWGQGFYTISTSGAYAGNQSAKMSTIFDPTTASIVQWPSDTIAGFMQQFVSGPVNNASSLFLNYAYKNNTITGDSALVIVQIYDTLTADPGDDVIMYVAGATYTGTNSTWTLASLPLQELNPVGNPNAFLVFATSSIGFAFQSGNGYPGSTLELDNISLSNSSISNVAELQNDVVIYPNPASDVLNIKADGEISNLTISTLEGKVVISTTSSSVNVSELNSGMYIYQVTVNGKVTTGNFIKK